MRCMKFLLRFFLNMLHICKLVISYASLVSSFYNNLYFNGEGCFKLEFEERFLGTCWYTDCRTGRWKVSIHTYSTKVEYYIYEFFLINGFILLGEGECWCGRLVAVRCGGRCHRHRCEKSSQKFDSESKPERIRRYLSFFNINNKRFSSTLFHFF
jgi:hypothetical protein